MKRKNSSIKSTAKTKRGKRQYASPEATLFTHPTRAKIIEQLKSGNKTTSELESLIGENRINLYHHLNLLESEEIISSKVVNRQKLFGLEKNSRIDDPKIIFISIPKDIEIRKEVIDSIHKILKFVNSGSLSNQLNDLQKLEQKKVIIEFL